jgi:hypothetical protein
VWPAATKSEKMTPEEATGYQLKSKSLNIIHNIIQLYSGYSKYGLMIPIVL